MPLVPRTCLECGIAFKARQFDLDRGWGKCCSKSCAATQREKNLTRKGQRFGVGARPRKIINQECTL